MIESKKRSLAKALSWRLIALVITTLVAWYVTGQVALSLGIGLADSLVKIAAYYGHERFWNSLSFGLIKPGKMKGVQGEGI